MMASPGSRLLACLVLAGLWLPLQAMAQTTLSMTSELVPSSGGTKLTDGSTFRLLFLTNEGIAGNLSTIEAYDTFVRGEAGASDAHADISTFADQFVALVSHNTGGVSELTPTPLARVLAFLSTG